MVMVTVSGTIVATTAAMMQEASPSCQVVPSNYTGHNRKPYLNPQKPTFSGTHIYTDIDIDIDIDIDSPENAGFFTRLRTGRCCVNSKNK